MKFPLQKENLLFMTVKYIFILVFSLITVLLLFFNDSITYETKKIFLLPNWGLIVFDLLIIAAFYYILHKKKSKKIEFLLEHSNLIIICVSVLLLIIQGVISYNIYFATGWDVGSYIIPTSKLIANGSSLESVNEYFRRYPNNNVLVWIFSKLFLLKNNILGLQYYNDLTIIIIINCVISTFTGWLTYKVVCLLSNVKYGVFSWVIYVMLIGLSPWIVITYSDSLTLFIPILIFYLYLCPFVKRYIEIKWLMIGFLSFFGFYIRPQVIIIFIAIIIVEIWKYLIKSFTIEKFRYLTIFITLVLSFIVASSAKNMITIDTGLASNSDDVFSWTHFAMMGLNDERDGVYSDDDVIFSNSFNTAEERKSANLKEVANRINMFTPSSFIDFISRKALVNYGDGTFAWSVEGGFYMETYNDKNPILSPFLKSIYYDQGGNNKLASTVQHAVWIMVVISLLGISFVRKSKSQPAITVLMLALIGLTLFEMIFEARARYLYIYSPIFISLSIIGVESIIKWTQNKYSEILNYNH